MATDRTEQPDELRRVLQEAERSQQSPEVRNLILREDTARVTLNIWPQLVPRESVDPSELIEAVQRELGAHLDSASLLQRVPLEARGGLTQPLLLGHALQDDDVVIRFRGGFLAIPESRRVTTIRDLAVGEQSLTATVVGSTSEAEYCVRQLAIILSRAAGFDRVWSDFEPHVELTAYLTSTVVDLGSSMTHLFTPKVQAFLEDEVGNELGLGTLMGSFASFDGGFRRGLTVVPSVHRIEFRVGIMDSVSGLSEACSVEMLTHTQSDANRSRVKIVTELRSQDHRKFVERLVHALDAT